MVANACCSRAGLFIFSIFRNSNRFISGKRHSFHAVANHSCVHCKYADIELVGRPYTIHLVGWTVRAPFPKQEKPQNLVHFQVIAFSVVTQAKSNISTLLLGIFYITMSGTGAYLPLHATATLSLCKCNFNNLSRLSQTMCVCVWCT